MKVLQFVVGFAFLYSASADKYELTCEDNQLLRGFRSNEEFFTDYIFPICEETYDGQNVCPGGSQQVYPDDSGLSAACPDTNQVVKSATIEFYPNDNPSSLSIQCCTVANEPTDAGDVTSGRQNEVVDCGSGNAIKKITLSGGNPKAYLSCVLFN